MTIDTSGSTAERPVLERSLSLWQVTISGVGIVVGAGIYVLVGEAAGEAGSLVWASFILAAVLGGLTGLSYAELAASSRPQVQSTSSPAVPSPSSSGSSSGG